MAHTWKWNRYLGLAGGVVAALGLMLAASQVANPPGVAQGTGEGSPSACDNPTATASGSDDLATYNAGAGNVVTGVCIKSGTNAFAGAGHSGLFTSNGTVDSCYTISGIGTQTVTVTRTGSGPTCQGISHIDVFVASATMTPTATTVPPTSTATTVAPTSTPTEVGPTATATEVAPTSTPTEFVPSPTNTPAGEAVATNTPASGVLAAPTATSFTTEVQGATQQQAQGETEVAGSSVQRLPSTGSSDTRSDDSRLATGVVLTVIGSLIFAGSRLAHREHAP